MVLELFEEKYLQNTFEWMQNSRLKYDFLMSRIVTKESHINWYKEYLQDSSQKIWAALVDEVHIGNIGIKNIDYKENTAEVWLYIGNQEYYGKGYGAQMILELIKDKNFESLTIKKLYSHVADWNIPSQKSFLKAGFYREAELKDCLIFDNKHVTLFRYAFDLEHNRKKLLLLGAGEMQVPLIQKAKSMGFYTIVADMSANAPGMNIADMPVLVSTMDKEGILECCKANNVSGILTISDAPVNVVSYVGQILNLPTMSTEVANICTNKYLQRKLFAKNGINVPFFKLCAENTDLSIFNKFPYIVKPVDSSASRGVKKVFNTNELLKAFIEAMEFSRTKNVIIESFISGREFSVETFTQNKITTVVAITEKQCIGEKEGYFVEDTHIQPARISNKDFFVIEEEVRKAISAIGIDNCPTHTEVKLNEKGAYVIEIACRLGGDYITSDLVPLSTGVDMLENLIKIAIGENIKVKRKYNKCSAVQFLNPNNYKRCTDFIESKDPHIVRYEIKPYQDKQIQNSLDRMGYVIVQADHMRDIEEIILKIK